MRKKIILPSAVLLLVVSMLFLGRVRTAERIEKVVDITVYTDSDSLPSQIQIDGILKKAYFPSASSFEGTFAIGYIEKTCRAGCKAMIIWSSKQASFAIMDSETFSLVPVSSIEISGQMENIRIVFSDGTVIESR